jgi:hypothetical protein
MEISVVSTHDSRREGKFHLFGWILFLVCAGLFIASSIKAGDILALAASILFLVGCVVFIIPIVIKRERDESK